MANSVNKRTVQEVIVDRIIESIETTNRLPWQRPFVSPCMNWFSNTEYKGINTILLTGGEYITMNQLNQYNEKHNTTYMVEKGSKSEMVVFYTKKERPCTAEESEEYENEGIPVNLIFKVYKNEEGKWMRKTWVLRYFNVFNINVISDKEGNKLPHKIGVTVFEKHTPAENIVDKYTLASGVRVLHDVSGSCYYTELDDAVHAPSTCEFKSSEGYYRTIFHELIHSTGVSHRLNRTCFEKYRKLKERSREELIAEVGSLLLASEAGFKNDYCDDNSIAYIQSWCKWMKENTAEVVTGMYQAEKAKSYILEGTQVEDKDYHSDSSESKIK